MLEMEEMYELGPPWRSIMKYHARVLERADVYHFERCVSLVVLGFGNCDLHSRQMHPLQLELIQ